MQRGTPIALPETLSLVGSTCDRRHSLCRPPRSGRHPGISRGPRGQRTPRSDHGRAPRCRGARVARPGPGRTRLERIAVAPATDHRQPRPRWSPQSGVRTRPAHRHRSARRVRCAGSGGGRRVRIRGRARPGRLAARGAGHPGAGRRTGRPAGGGGRRRTGRSPVGDHGQCVRPDTGRGRRPLQRSTPMGRSARAGGHDRGRRWRGCGNPGARSGGRAGPTGGSSGRGGVGRRRAPPAPGGSTRCRQDVARDPTARTPARPRPGDRPGGDPHPLGGRPHRRTGWPPDPTAPAVAPPRGLARRPDRRGECGAASR